MRNYNEISLSLKFPPCYLIFNVYKIIFYKILWRLFSCLSSFVKKKNNNNNKNQQHSWFKRRRQPKYKRETELVRAVGLMGRGPHTHNESNFWPCFLNDVFSFRFQSVLFKMNKKQQHAQYLLVFVDALPLYDQIELIDLIKVTRLVEIILNNLFFQSQIPHSQSNDDHHVKYF